MTTKNYFLVNGIVCLLFAIPLLFMPSLITDTYMVASETYNGISEVLGRAYGTAITGLGVIFLTARKASASYGRKAILLGGLITNVLICLVHIYSITDGLENSSAWGTVVLCLGLAIWAGILWNKETVNV